MKRTQKDRFEQGGWKVGTASELLGLTEAEEALVETKLRLGEAATDPAGEEASVAG